MEIVREKDKGGNEKEGEERARKGELNARKESEITSKQLENNWKSLGSEEHEKKTAIKTEKRKRADEK
jgi:hypothetical protein